MSSAASPPAMSRSLAFQSRPGCYRCLRLAPSHRYCPRPNMSTQFTAVVSCVFPLLDCLYVPAPSRCKTRALHGCRASLLQAQASKDPPPAPPLQEIPPPPPPPPDSGPARNVGFWTRRNIFGVMLAGSGLWYWKNWEDLDPHVTFSRRESTPDGMEIMITPTGEPYGVTLVKNKYGGHNFLMLDAYGNIYYDPNDRSQGLYIVRHLHSHCSVAFLAVAPCSAVVVLSNVTGIASCLACFRTVRSPKSQPSTIYFLLFNAVGVTHMYFAAAELT